MVNGQVIGVPESFYDFQIRNQLTDQPIIEAYLIGNILNKYPKGASDWWYARRIDYYIEQEKIVVVDDSKNKYERVICLSKDNESELCV